ncbi:MAG TPA: hypothetical protein VGC79_32380 [Polyangiaceae bacterium]
MAAKKKPLRIDKLLEDYKQPYELVILWEPEEDQPMRLYLVQVNGTRLAVDQLDVSSPSRFPLSTPTDGKFNVRFALSPTVPISGGVIAIVNHATGAKEVVDKTGPLERSQLWRKMEVIVDAP